MLEVRPRALRLRRNAIIAAAALALLAAAPAAHAADQLALIDKTEPVGPGITLRHEKFLDSTGWYDEQVLTVDLANAAVKSDLLTAPSVAQGEPLSTMANRVGAAAGVNGDFFDIDNTGASTGGEVQGGALIKSADVGGWAHVGVSKTGIGQLVDLTLQATATLNGTAQPIASINAADAGGIPANSMIAYNSAWGTATRARPLTGVANVAEALVQDGKVVSVSPTVGAGAIPANGFYLVGRDAAATAIKALNAGDPVTLTYGLKDAIAQQMQWAIGTNKPLVTNGVALAEGDTSVAPRTAIGFKDGGRTMFLLITDGRQTQVTGTTLKQTADMLVALGADTGLNLDGGGSTTLVARPLGGDQATLRNTPSDGHERSDPAGIGLFVTPGDGKADKLIVGTDARIFPGLHRTLTASAVDDHDTPVKADVTWTGAPAGVVHAPSDASGTITVHAAAGSAGADAKVTVLHPMRTLELSSNRLSFADALPEDAQTLNVAGRDDQGYAAPIELQDMTLDYDHALLKIEETAPGTLRLTPLAPGGTTVDFKAAGLEEKLPVTIGVVQTNVYRFNHADEVSRWGVNGTVAANQKLGLSADGYLTLTYKAERNSGLSAKTGFAITLPGSPLRVHLKLNSTAALQYSYISYKDAKGITSGPLGSPIKAGENDLVFAFPATTTFPVTISSTQVIETNVANQKDGVVTFESIDEDSSATVASPPQDPLEPDALFSADGTTNGSDDWSFGTLSDVQFTAASPNLAKVGVSALERIRQTHPDLIVLNGDITDDGAAEDTALARTTLEQGGCRLIPLTSTIGTDATPAPTADKTPCYYIPGNHESYRVTGQGDLAPWIAQFGQPYGTFDHNGTRFILLASSYGTLSGTAWDQMPMFKRALDDAETDPAVKNVMVFAHHPVDDPAETDASQLGDRTEVALVEKMLSDFRADSDKGVAMVGSHAQIADVHRIEGVPYTVLPSSGKDPYGVPDRGGFTGWLDWHVDKDATAGQQWLTADVRAFAQSITLNAPATLEAGDAAQLSGSIVQPEGVTAGTRVVPLAYPMSVHWSGSDDLAIGSGDAAIAAAKAAGKDAILDPVTRKLTGLHTGDVTVRVTNDSMREYTGPDSLAPIVAEKIVHVQVTHVASDAPVGGTVPATLSLTLGAPASFGAFVPGVAKEYTAQTTANVISSAGDAALTVSASGAVVSPPGETVGHLANGTFTLPQPLRVDIAPATWSAPVANDPVTIGFKQSIGATDALRTGSYSRSLTFTLSTTTP
jgi:3',5'-cyclic AMP phosphodiesterase CpdA